MGFSGQEVSVPAEQKAFLTHHHNRARAGVGKYPSTVSNTKRVPKEEISPSLDACRRQGGEMLPQSDPHLLPSHTSQGQRGASDKQNSPISPKEPNYQLRSLG